MTLTEKILERRKAIEEANKEAVAGGCMPVTRFTFEEVVEDATMAIESLVEAINSLRDAISGDIDDEVVVRAIRKDDLHIDYVPVGHTTGLAARMESLATPGAILVTESTYRRSEGYFDFQSLGTARVKGVSEPVPLYEVVGVSALRTRFQAAARRGLVPFVGRQPEFGQMQRALALVQEGQGRIVAIVGEPKAPPGLLEQIVTELTVATERLWIVRGQDARLAVAAQIQARTAPGSPPSLRGQIRALSGDVEVLAKPFRLERGVITLIPGQKVIDPELDLLAGHHHRRAAELADADIEGDAGPQRRLLEDHGDDLAFEQAVAGGSRRAPAGLDLLAGLEDRPQLAG